MFTVKVSALFGLPLFKFVREVLSKYRPFFSILAPFSLAVFVQSTTPDKFAAKCRVRFCNLNSLLFSQLMFMGKFCPGSAKFKFDNSLTPEIIWGAKICRSLADGARDTRWLLTKTCGVILKEKFPDLFGVMSCPSIIFTPPAGREMFAVSFSFIMFAFQLLAIEMLFISLLP